MFFRNRFLTRAMACFLLLEIVFNLAWPSVSWAMSGPSQPEFTSYEGPGATDMVNLSTGDLSYSIPLLDIPGPERSFSMPLTYKAGISLEQEAAWVGLGWSLNPGALARNVVGYPDDAAHDTVQVNYKKEIDRGWSLNWGIINTGWSSNTGKYGSVDLLGLASVNWDKDGVAGGDLVGIGYDARSGSVNINPVRMALAVFTIATLGAGSTLSLAANVGIQLGASTAIGIGMAAAGIGRLGGVSGFNTEPSRYVNSRWYGLDEYWTFFDNRATEYAYGSLHFGDMSQQKPNWTNDQQSRGPTLTVNGNSIGRAQPFHNVRNCGNDGNWTAETASDIYQYGAKSDGSYYASSFRPISTAHDYFSVMGEGVTGSIRPNRLDMGSVANPQVNIKEGKHFKYDVAGFLPEQSYKVGFRYDNSISNGYDYHDYTPAGSANRTGFDINSGNNSIAITDPRLQDGGNRTAPAREGLYDGTNGNRRLVQGKHVVWYTNQEIKSMYTGSLDGNGSGFLEFERPTAASGSNNPFREHLRPTAIGAFAVTAEDGTTYHYSLPVLQFKIHTQSDEIHTTVGEPGKFTHDEKGYTTTWLLTAITSPDYIDRNHSGTVDAADWGGWVRFQYGKFSSAYKWRQPYIGTSYGEDDANLDMAGYSEGYKQTYYLNSISTRSHTALFVKSVRHDARGHFQANVWPGGSNHGNFNLDERYPASSLRLDEVILLDNATLAKLQTPDGIRATGDTQPLPALTNSTATGYFPNEPFTSYDHMDNVLDVNDLSVDSRIKNFVYANAIRRIRFNYGYDLCRGTPNSFSGPGLPSMTKEQMSKDRSGKLTLKSVSVFGPSIAGIPTKIVPDFAFEYGGQYNNPNYSKECWDGFGMYRQFGQRNITSHTASAAVYPAPWSLSRITSPLGGMTDVTYERDTYAHVSEYGTTKIRLSNTNCSRQLQVNKLDFQGVITDFIKPDTWLPITGTAFFVCPSGGIIGRKYTSQYVQVESITSSGNNSWLVTLKPAFQPTPEGGDSYCNSSNASGFSMQVETTLPQNKVGGDIRVASITTADESGNAYKVRYLYTTDANTLVPNSGFVPMANSSGVISKEPGFIGRFEYDFEGNYDYPATPVLYSKVTVFRGILTNNSTNWDQREVYSFITPEAGMVTNTFSPDWRSFNNGTNAHVELYANRTVVDAGRIGQPRQVQVYNRHGQQELSTDFTYASTIANTSGRTGQGHFTEGLLSNEMLDYDFYRINRSVKEYVPSVMSGSRSTRNGISIENTNLLYDYYTGQVVETSFRNSRNQVYHSRSVPAYTLFPGMGAKGDNGSNSHMLAQQAAFYTYKEKAGGVTYDPMIPFNPRAVGMLSAGVQLWSNSWTGYRTSNTAGTYEDETGTQQPVWRQAASYVWQSSLVNPDGTFNNFTNFAWTGTPVASWIKGGEVVRYDHYSHGVESRDVNGLYSTSKTGYNQTQLIATAANARYTELAYSGAEDKLLVGGNIHYGGEVTSQGTQDNTVAHTGEYSTRTTIGQNGFLYQGVGGVDLLLNKQYQLSAWVHSSDASRVGQLFIDVNGTSLATATIASAQTRKAGDWYRLSVTASLPASANGQLVQVGCRNMATGNSSATVNFDDFRFWPVNGTASSSVYDAKMSKQTFALDNENLFTRYEYDKNGRLKRVYKEAFDKPNQPIMASKLLKEYDYNFANMNNPSWEAFAYRCKMTPYGDYTNMDERQERAIDPANPSQYIYSSWIENNPSVECKSCGPHPQQVFYVPAGASQGSCITARVTISTTSTGTGANRMCRDTRTYHYDGTTMPNYMGLAGTAYSCPGTGTVPTGSDPASPRPGNIKIK